jgi:hypothetical protein
MQIEKEVTGGGIKRIDNEEAAFSGLMSGLNWCQLFPRFV